MEKKKKRQVPHVYALLIGIVVICAILTYIVPAGSYEMMTLKDGREVVDPNSFQYTEQTPVDLMGVLSSVFLSLIHISSSVPVPSSSDRPPSLTTPEPRPAKPFPRRA